MTLRVLIADDEPLARARMRRLLLQEEGVEIVAECADGAEAARQIEQLHPDVAFLDVEMPELDGFEVLGATNARRPAIVFVTAYDSYAVRAFEEHALDYVLKPVDAERLHQSIARARRATVQRLARMVIRTRGRIVLLPVDEITHIEAAGNYARVHTAKDHHLIRQTFTDLEAKLDATRFVRIHRSLIVNATLVREVRPWFRGDALVVMTDGRELTLSRTYRDRAARVLGIEADGD